MAQGADVEPPIKQRKTTVQVNSIITRSHRTINPTPLLVKLPIVDQTESELLDNVVPTPEVIKVKRVNPAVSLEKCESGQKLARVKTRKDKGKTGHPRCLTLVLP